jgi:hypothetical protein
VTPDIVHIRSASATDRCAAGFELDSWPGDERSAVYRFDDGIDVDRTGDAWLPAMLPILMSAGRDARFGDPLDALGLANAALAQDVLRGWHPDLRPVRIYADLNGGSVPAPGTGVGCFFSGGVDSFYSVLDRQAEITHLIFVVGFDIDMDDAELAEKALRGVRAAAEELGKTLVVVRTDVRRLSDRWAAWGDVYHGAALATVGLLLAEHVGRVIIPSSYRTDELFPWGTHPALDPLWSTSRVRFEHHGVERHRTDKVGAVSSNPVALRHLRVCWENRGGEYNCGECEKCIRTMITLRAYGALEQCATLPPEVDPALLRRLRRPSFGVGAFARENLELLASRHADDPRLVRELRALVRRERFWRTARGLRTRLQTKTRTV